MSKTLITGGAGFIGYHLANKFLETAEKDIIVIDNLNTYYDVELKNNRLKNLIDKYGDRLTFIQLDLVDVQAIDRLFAENEIDVVVNLAAQAGVRYARENPRVYIDSNVNGFFNILDASRRNNVRQVVYASSSSVYGGNTNLPFSESDKCDNPLSVYASSKISNEMLAESYANTFGLKSTGLRFFNVYGPFGRPDAVYYKWAQALLSGGEIELRDDGELFRDMTYIGDVVESIKLLIEDGFNEVEAGNNKHEVYNIGNENPVRMGDLLEFLASKLDVSLEHANINRTKRGAEEPVTTRASTDKLRNKIGFAPDTSFIEGIPKFVEWYRRYYEI